MSNVKELRAAFTEASRLADEASTASVNADKALLEAGKRMDAAYDAWADAYDDQTTHDEN